MSGGSFQTPGGYGKVTFTQKGEGSSLTLRKGQTTYSFNSGISDDVKTILSNVALNNSASNNVADHTGYIGLGGPVYPNTNQLSNVFTPTVAINYWKNNEEYEAFSGIQNKDTSTKVSNTTVFPFFSETKSVTALMYARMKTLGIIPNVKKVDDIFPNMSNVYWSTSTLSTTESNARTDFTGSNTQTQYMLANDVFSLPSVANPPFSLAFTDPGYTLKSPVGYSNNYIYF